MITKVYVPDKSGEKPNFQNSAWKKQNKQNPTLLLLGILGLFEFPE
jgi:hypothetical protein